MVFVIVKCDGEILADITGRAFTFQARADAQCFLMPGEIIVEVEDDLTEQINPTRPRSPPERP